jgi:molecular chaperone DnaK
MSSKERRVHHRLPLRMLVQFRLHDMDEFERIYAVNISAGGMFIRTSTPHPIGAMIYLQFQLEDGKRLIEGLGKVVHVNPPDDPSPGMGVEFVNLDDASRLVIEEIVSSRIDELGEA